jgi:hypothetical protein
VKTNFWDGLDVHRGLDADTPDVIAAKKKQLIL